MIVRIGYDDVYDDKVVFCIVGKGNVCYFCCCVESDCYVLVFLIFLFLMEMVQNVCVMFVCLIEWFMIFII